MKTDELLRHYPIISDQVDARELSVLLTILERQLRENTAKNIVEFGCYAGTTSLFIRRLCKAYNFDGEFHVYDSFAGLPEKTSEDKSAAGEQFIAGELRATRKMMLQNFKKAGLQPPIIHKGWFDEIAASDVPDQISFAFLDGDYYQSIKTSLALISSKLTKNAVIVVDDYASEALPGAARATDEWRRTHQSSLRVEASLAIIRLA